MYKGMMVLNNPVHIPINNRPMIIAGAIFTKHMTKLITARKLVNKKLFLTY